MRIVDKAADTASASSNSGLSGRGTVSSGPLPQGTGFDYLIVGAGFAGSVIAERLAARYGQRVLLVDRRWHIGGNAYDEYNTDGILIHRYGPHIFHTNAQRVVD